MTLHTADERRRIEAYNIRAAVAVDGLLGLRKPSGSLDATAVVVESTLRERAGLPRWIRELDAPAEYRNPAPWAYCDDAICLNCHTARTYKLPPLTTAPRWLLALAAWIVARIDAVTALLARRRAGGPQ